MSYFPMEHAVWFYLTIFQSMLSNMAVDQNYFVRIFGVDGSQNQIDTWARRCAYLWLYNPLVMTVSARGNAESIVVTLVLATLHLYQVRTIKHSYLFNYFEAYMKWGFRMLKTEVDKISFAILGAGVLFDWDRSWDGNSLQNIPNHFYITTLFGPNGSN